MKINCQSLHERIGKGISSSISKGSPQERADWRQNLIFFSVIKARKGDGSEEEEDPIFVLEVFIFVSKPTLQKTSLRTLTEHYSTPTDQLVHNED